MGKKRKEIKIVIENPDKLEKASEKFIEIMYKFYVESKTKETIEQTNYR